MNLGLGKHRVVFKLGLAERGSVALDIVLEDAHIQSFPRCMHTSNDDKLGLA